MVFSHCGMPPVAGAPVPVGAGRCPLPADGGGGNRVRAARARRGRRWRCRAPDRQHGPGADRVRVRTDDPPVGRVQRRPAAAHGQHGGDARQGVTGRDRVAGRSHPAGQHQDGAGADRVRIRTDERPVGRVQRRPAAAHGEPRGDAGQRVTRPHGIPRDGTRHRLRCRGHAQRAGQGDLSSTTRSAYVRLSWRDGSLHAGRHQDDQDAPGEHGARGLQTRMHLCAFPSEGDSAPERCWPGRAERTDWKERT